MLFETNIGSRLILRAGYITCNNILFQNFSNLTSSLNIDQIEEGTLIGEIPYIIDTSSGLIYFTCRSISFSGLLSIRPGTTSVYCNIQHALLDVQLLRMISVNDPFIADIHITADKVSISNNTLNFVDVDLTGGSDSLIDMNIGDMRLGTNTRGISLRGNPDKSIFRYKGDSFLGGSNPILQVMNSSSVVFDVNLTQASNGVITIDNNSSDVSLCGKFISTTTDTITIVQETTKLKLRNVILISEINSNTISMPANTTLQYTGQVTRNTDYNMPPAIIIPSGYPLLAPDPALT